MQNVLSDELKYKGSRWPYGKCDTVFIVLLHCILCCIS